MMTTVLLCAGTVRQEIFEGYKFLWLTSIHENYLRIYQYMVYV